MDLNWFSERARLQREASNISFQISDLEMEKFGLENADHIGYYQLVEPNTYNLMALN